jgi:hypothetical protein
MLAMKNVLAERDQIATLIFDRPFTFTIVSSEGLPLFTGIVNNPTA